MRCPLCAYTRPLRPEEEAWEASVAPLAKPRVEPPPEAQGTAPGRVARAAPTPAETFASMPMPVFRRGAAVPAPPKPRGYEPPRGAR